MEEFFKDNFALLFVLSIATAIVAIFAAIVYRTIKGKHYPVIPEQDVRFTERWVSGASQKNLLTKLGGASNCLSVTLSSNALVIRPMFPFNLMFFPEIYDLEHVISRSSIKNIEPGGSSSSRTVLVEFESDGTKKRIVLTLRRREEFLRAVEL